MSYTDAQVQKAMDLYASGATNVTINGRTVQIAGDLLKRIQAMQSAQAAATAGPSRGNARRITFRR